MILSKAQHLPILITQLMYICKNMENGKVTYDNIKSLFTRYTNFKRAAIVIEPHLEMKKTVHYECTRTFCVLVSFHRFSFKFRYIAYTYSGA